MSSCGHRRLAALGLFIAGLLGGGGTGPAAWSAEPVPQFRAYPAGDTHQGPNAPLIMTAQQRSYRTRLSEAAGQRPNFAGHYVLTTWGCGTSCETGAIYDARTGRVIDIPFTICCDQAAEQSFKRIEFRPNSRLIVFAGLRNEQDPMGAHFYALEGGRLRFIKTIPDDGSFRRH